MRTHFSDGLGSAVLMILEVIPSLTFHGSMNASVTFAPGPSAAVPEDEGSWFVALSVQTNLPRPVLPVAKPYLRSDRISIYPQN